MNPLALPFDSDQMLAGLRPWVECESPTWDAAAVSRMMAMAARDLSAIGATVETIPGTGGFGDSIRASFPHPDQGKPGILVSGHFDTVHPIGTLEKLPFRVQDGRAYGPGIQDMKGGNYVMLEAMRQILKAGLQTPLPVTFLFTPDEEVGTPATRDLIEDHARGQRAVLVPEPASADGGAVIGRYAIARFDLLTQGRPSHAGWALKDGRSAIAAMARKILEIEAMTTEDCTFSVGVIHAGQWVNCVSSECRAEVLSMAKTQADLDRGVAAIEALQGHEGGVDFIVNRGVTRPVWEPDQGTMQLYDLAHRLSAQIGFELTAGSAGGGSDGNFTGAMGVPTLDSIGPRGAGLHTLNEHIQIDSLAERARLAAGLMMEIR
ncbi:M20/M25/M40 family metallo-hydrolase [Paracoccus fistulariae]|uniref:M20/M25/M40 family metallo-hydrolase n=1 Tax=Paracoccus fistulariae TaxID=658446 RepID=A0ABY7SKM4_9RHOB|nr:M20/M25/M40 family metallo-hydrolase [Paracoccus fistulariae]MDB6180663.1 M20/M25/M40 family metallo-hydrolase [Paracoccus fistulariae]WCR07103.1 M20/M25/M40 family metallo-hydrolase [Paracoccus fistulariae]